MNVSFAAAGRPTTLAVRNAVRTAKHGDPLTPVRVLVPSNLAGLSLRRMLGSSLLDPEPTLERPGVANVSFSTPFQFASSLAATTLAERGERPLTNAVLAAAVRHVLSVEPGRFGSVADHVATEAALMRAYGDITALPLDRRAKLRGTSVARTHDLLTFVEAVELHLRSGSEHPYHDELAVFSIAGERCIAGQLDEAIVAAGPFDQGAAAVDFLRAAWSAAPDAHAVFAATGDDIVDTATRDQAVEITGTPPRLPNPAAVPLPSTMLPVADADEEVRSVVRSVLAAAANGARFDRMAVFVPSREPYLRTLREQFDAAGVPTAGPEHRTLADSVTGRLLLRLIALAESMLTTSHEQRFSRDEVLALVDAAPLRGPDGRPVDPTVWDNISRSAGVVAGLDDWEHKLDAHERSLRKRLDDRAADAGTGFTSATEREAAATARLRDFVVWVASLTAPSSMGRTWAERAAWATNVIDVLLPQLNRRSSWPESELEAGERVETILSRVSVLDGIEPQLTSGAFSRAISLELDAPSGRRGRFGTGVLVAPLASAIGLDLDHVFVVGLAEGICPRPIREDTLLPDAERALVDGALPVRADRNRAERERYLHALGAGNRSCTIVMPLGDHRTGRDRTASRWWVEAARELADDPEITSQSWTNAPLFEGRSLASYQLAVRASIVDGVTVSHADLQLQRIHASVAARATLDTDELAGPLRRGLAQIDERSSGFGRFAGNLTELDLPAVANVDAAISSSRLEAWAGCPRRYFFGQLLGLGEIERPEEIREISALDRGSLWHAILEDFIAGSLPGQPHALTSPDQKWSTDDEARLREIAARRYGEYEALGRTGNPLLWAISKEELDSDLESFLREDENLRSASQTLPTRVELPFGMSHDGDGGARAAEVALSDGRSLRLRGLIDRVDTAANGTPVVLDYKTGKKEPQKTFDADPVAGGTKLQLGVYAEAAKQHYQTDIAHAYYWYTSTKGGFVTSGYPWTADRRQRFIEALDTIVEGIESGVFPPNPGDYSAFHANYTNCAYCAFTRICPTDRDEELERAIATGRLQDFVQLREGPATDDDEQGGAS